MTFLRRIQLIFLPLLLKLFFFFSKSLYSQLKHYYKQFKLAGIPTKNLKTIGILLLSKFLNKQEIICLIVVSRRISKYMITPYNLTLGSFTIHIMPQIMYMP